MAVPISVPALTLKCVCERDSKENRMANTGMSFLTAAETHDSALRAGSVALGIILALVTMYS